MIPLLLMLMLGVSGQDILRPTGRMAPGTPAPTPTVTPTPDPCADCPEPDGFSCAMWPMVCYQCWEDCGRPIATPTVTPTPTKTPTPTPPPTPTPQGPACELLLPSGGVVYMVAYYLHESSVSGTRYSFQTVPVGVVPGSTLRPCPCEGHPVGFEWYTSDGVLLKSCGDTSTKHWHIFSDGFESGDLEAWNE